MSTKTIIAIKTKENLDLNRRVNTDTQEGGYPSLCRGQPPCSDLARGSTTTHWGVRALRGRRGGRRSLTSAFHVVYMSIPVSLEFLTRRQKRTTRVHALSPGVSEQTFL